MSNGLYISEIFESIDGEVTGHYQGRLTTFIRLAGCSLKCNWGCDTPYAMDKSEAKYMNIDDITLEIEKIGNHNLTITGGEPLEQVVSLCALLEPLIDDYSINIETNGVMSIPERLQNGITYTMDYKLPSSGFDKKKHHNLDNYKCLRSEDFIKFVILTEQDYKEAIKAKRRFQRDEDTQFVNFAFGLVNNGMYPNCEFTYKTLIKRLQEDKQYDVIVNVQLHKLLNLK